MSARCIRCGIDVSEEGRACRDCQAVAPRYVAQLREQADRQIRARREKENLLRGMTHVGTTAKTRQRERDKGRKR